MSEQISLQPHLDSAAAQPLAAELMERKGQVVNVDASAVSFAGTLALQVLVAAYRQWQDDGVGFSIAPVSQKFTAACSSLGVALDEMGVSPDAILEGESTA